MGRWIVMAVVWVTVGAMMFTAQMEFFAKISDPMIGGTLQTYIHHHHPASLLLGVIIIPAPAASAAAVQSTADFIHHSCALNI